MSEKGRFLFCLLTYNHHVDALGPRIGTGNAGSLELIMINASPISLWSQENVVNTLYIYLARYPHLVGELCLTCY